MKHFIQLLFTLFLLSSCNSLRVVQKLPESIGPNYGIATQGIYATKAAVDIFEKGGNAIDAAIAASFTISVERPHSTGIGGGGFMLFRDAATKKIYAIDFRERAPLSSTTNMYLDEKGNPIANLSINGVKAIATPGLVAGLLEIHEKFGRLSRSDVLSSAIELAEKGFKVYPSLAKALSQKEDELIKDKDATKIFLDGNKKALKEGDILIQKDLASTLKLISREGKKAFYEGEIAKNFEDNHFVVTKKDLGEYKVLWREPLKGNFKGYSIFSMPPPSSGGIHVLQFLSMLEEDHLKEKGFLSAQSIHLAASALQSAFADRAKYLGDPDFINVPTKDLISKDYAKKRRAEIDSNRARKAQEVSFGKISGYEHDETTHLSIIDKEGNMIATTQTINGYMGSSVVLPHTGIVLNNEMDDFSAKPGASNLFGAVGSKANAIAPKKTPLSSMSPTLILNEKDDPILSVGAPGGTRIISCVAQTILNYLEFKLPPYESIASARYHQQWLPDELDLEPGKIPQETIEKLKQMGHNVQEKSVNCNVMAVAKEENLFRAVSDPRDIGTSHAR